MDADAELLRRYVADRADGSFAILVERYLRLVYATALRELAGDAHRASDVAQLTFATLARKAPALTSHPMLAGWLHRTTRHLALKSIRAEQRRISREQEAHAMEELNRAVESTDWTEIQQVVDWALERLDRRDREAILRRFFGEQSFDQIGTALAVTEPAARMRVNRALDKLRKALGRRGVTSTTAALSAALAAYGGVTAPPGLANVISGAAISMAPSGALLGQFILFMSTAKTILGTVAIAAIGMTLYQFNNARHTEAALASVTRDRDAMARRVETGEKQIRDLRTQIAELSKGNSNKAAAPANRNSGGGSQFVNLTAADYKALSGNPAFRKVEVEALKGNLDQRYAALFKTLGLTPAQLDPFKDLLIEKQLATNDARGLAREQGINPTSDPEGYAQLLREAVASIDSQVKATIGDTAYDQYEQYDQTLPEHTFVSQLQRSLSYTQAPLTDDQASRMIQVLVEAGAPTTPLGASPDNPTVVISDKTLEIAQTVLTPAQLQTLQQIQSQQRAQQQFMQLTRAFKQGVTSGRTPP